jgi:hypothetical protein
MCPRRLLAVDLDGTLVRADGTLDPRDTAALARARRAGVAVTLATGRLAPSALALARTLHLDTSLICADGAALVCARTGVLIEGLAIGAGALALLLDALAAHRLAPFVCLSERIVGDASSRSHVPYVESWSPVVETHAVIGDALSPRDAVVMALGIGLRARVEAALGDARRALDGHVDLAAFTLGEGAPWALRAQPRGTSKGAALARLAGQLGVVREEVAAIGDWYNDISMLAWAGRSFAMGKSPPEVQEAARDEVVKATAGMGGGVAEAVERWLG